MKIALVTKSPIGWFAFSEAGELLANRIFKPSGAIEQYSKKMPEDFTAALQGYAAQEDIRAERFLRTHMRKYAQDLGFSSTNAELNKFLVSFATNFSSIKLVGVIGRDRLVIQSVGAFEDVSRASNGLLMRLSEWYGLHYPELKLSNEKLADTIQEYGQRESIPGFSKSVGVALSQRDTEIIRGFASAAGHMLVQKRSIEQYVKSSIREIAPNFSSLIDELLAARLLALAGSLEKLSKMSASTIQLLGAERALFRHLKNKGRAPKFGLIFMSEWIQSASESMRGKVARVLAAKLMVAARIDYYSGRNESAMLRKELEADISALRKEETK